MLTKEQRQALKAQTRYFAIDPDSDKKPKKKTLQNDGIDGKKDYDEFTDGFYSSSSSEIEIVDFEKNDKPFH